MESRIWSFDDVQTGLKFLLAISRSNPELFVKRRMITNKIIHVVLEGIRTYPVDKIVISRSCEVLGWLLRGMELKKCDYLLKHLNAFEESEFSKKVKKTSNTNILPTSKSSNDDEETGLPLSVHQIIVQAKDLYEKDSGVISFVDWYLSWRREVERDQENERTKGMTMSFEREEEELEEKDEEEEISQSKRRVRYVSRRKIISTSNAMAEEKTISFLQGKIPPVSREDYLGFKN